MQAIQVDQRTARRLSRLAGQIGQPTGRIVHDAVLAYSAELTEIAAAEETLARIERGAEQTIPLAELERRLDALDG